MDLRTGAVHTHRRENLRFQKELTVERKYATMLLENAYSYELPEGVPLVRIKSVMQDDVVSDIANSEPQLRFDPVSEKSVEEPARRVQWGGVNTCKPVGDEESAPASSPDQAPVDPLCEQ